MTILNTLWVEKYRPQKLSDYVWRDDKQQSQVQKWINDKDIPHILLSGTQGLGKTSLINVILNEIGIDRGDVLEINASEETSIDVVRSKVLNFASTLPYGNFKVIVLEEFSNMSLSAQASLKRVFEEYSDNCRFILTTNERHKIIPPIQSRCQTFHMVSLDKQAFMVRLATILVNEEIQADIETLDNFVQVTFPDMRAAINAIQLNSINGVLHNPSSDNGSTVDWMIQMVDLFKNGKLLAAREFICSHADYNDYPEIYRFLYRNLQLFGDTEQQREDCILVIRDGIVKDTMVADREINLSATIVELARVKGTK